jgi:hypothetical protein
MRLAEVLANGETVPAGKLLDPEVGFPEITVDLLEARFWIASLLAVLRVIKQPRLGGFGFEDRSRVLPIEPIGGIMPVIPDKLRCPSQIAEPCPISMLAAKFHKPQTRQVENCHSQNPHGVNKRQSVTITERSLRKVGVDRAVPDGLAKS